MKIGLAVIFFIWMLTRSLYKKATWVQLTIVGLQIFSGVFFATVFILAAAKERYLSKSEQQEIK